ncbi:MAG: M14 family metallopeptidase [Planctomycetota bacterium]|nr:M14 family metallopeptidase [Planctomycetota bacterium]
MRHPNHPKVIVQNPFITIALMLVLAIGSGAWAQNVPSPSEHLGRPFDADFKLADWDQVSSYYRILGDRSPNVITQKAGTTTEGRDFLISIISSPGNLADLDNIKRRASTLADPRGKTDAELNDAVENGKVILFISCQMHSTEAAGSQFGMTFAHHLATSNDEPWASARDEVVVVIYNTNPDGIDHVTNWYRKTEGTPYEATGMLKLYQYYAGHDNNRDWFMLTQKETRIVTNLLYHEWFPTVYWDVHQQGSNGERLFVPPFRDPLNPNLSPEIMTGIDAIGSRALMDLTSEGFTGVSTGVSYDMWWNGGNRNVPVRHNIMGFLTEAASVNLASPIFLRKSDLRGPRGLGGDRPSNRFPKPWPGGWWRIGDIIRYEMAFGRSMLGSLSREPAHWRNNTMLASQRTIEKGATNGPRAWIIPSDNRDPDAVAKLLDVLLSGAVEVHVADAPIEADGRTYPAGSIVIHRNQPYGSYVNDLMEIHRYPEGDSPYDNAGWTLSLLMGVRRVEVMEDLQGDFREVETPAQAIAAFNGDSRVVGNTNLLSVHDSSTWTKVCESLQRGEAMTLTTTGEEAGIFRRGVTNQNSGNSQVLSKMPRIGLYAPWSGSMNEGWMRYVLDTYKIPYIRVRNEMIRAGDLGEFLDVLIITSIGPGQLEDGRSPGSIPEEYARGLAPEGSIAVQEFVMNGGTLINTGSSCQWSIDLFDMPLVDTTREEANEEFSCPGGVLRTIPSHGVYTVGLPDSMGVMFSRSSAFRMMTDEERKEAGREGLMNFKTPMAYASSQVLLSGWIKKPEVIEGKGAWMRAAVGEGAVHLFGFRPQYRGWAHGTFPLIFRAALLDGQD